MTLPGQQVGRRQARGSGDALGRALPDALPLLAERLRRGSRHEQSTALAELVAIADQHPALRADVVVAVCAFLRSPWRHASPAGGPQPAAAIPPPRDHAKPSSGEAQLRRAAMQVLAEHLRRPEDPTTWVGCDLDLAGAVLAGADFSSCWFTGGLVRLEGAWCIEGRLSFAAARFVGATVSLRHWSSGQGELDFEGAHFEAGVVTIAGAVLDRGRLSCAGARVDGGTLALTEARLSGATIDLTGISVTAGVLSLADAELLAGQVLLVDARLLGGVTVLRDVRLAPGVLVTSGTESHPGSLDVGERAGDAVVPAASTPSA